MGFLDYGNTNNLFKGFIPFRTRIKYNKLALETYSMETTDFFYDFAHFVRKNKINTKGSLVLALEYFINCYFGYPGKCSREVIFNDIAWQTTTTDEEYFAALENNKLGDLRGKGAAECTERSALAQQILSLFEFETYYCIGKVDLGDRQEDHCFNVIKRKNDYALLDYSVPVALYNQVGEIKNFYPFMGIITNEKFEAFVNDGLLESFDDYSYTDDKQKALTGKQRHYVIGTLEKEIKTLDEVKPL